jgi:hypothetical protein
MTIISCSVGSDTLPIEPPVPLAGFAISLGADPERLSRTADSSLRMPGAPRFSGDLAGFVRLTIRQDLTKALRGLSQG